KVGQTSNRALNRPQQQAGLIFSLWAGIGNRARRGRCGERGWQGWGQRWLGDLDFVANRFTLLSTNRVDESNNSAVRAQVRRNNPQSSTWNCVCSIELAGEFLTGLAHA